VVESSRFLPTLGWGLTVQIDRSEALAPVEALSLQMAGIGVSLLALAFLLSLLLARELTGPLRLLTEKMGSFRPDRLPHGPSVTSGDEVQTLDTVFTDMAGRLHTLYAHLEEEVRSRTAELKEQYVRDRAILE